MIAKRTVIAGAAGLITAAIVGGVTTAFMLNGSAEPRPQEIRIVQETSEPTPDPEPDPSPSAQPQPMPSQVLPSPLPAPRLACTKNAPANSPCKSPVPHDDSPQPRASTRG